MIKVGRTSKLTHGEINGTYSIANLSGVAYSFAWRIDTVKRAPFSVEGESGSWVIDEEGNLCGLLFVAVSGGSGMMVPVDTLVKDIQLRTGGVVVYPTPPNRTDG